MNIDEVKFNCSAISSVWLSYAEGQYKGYKALYLCGVKDGKEVEKQVVTNENISHNLFLFLSRDCREYNSVEFKVEKDNKTTTVGTIDIE